MEKNKLEELIFGNKRNMPLDEEHTPNIGKIEKFAFLDNGNISKETVPSYKYEELIFGNKRKNIPTDIDYSLVKDIDMGESGIATKEQPLIATDSLASCTGILAYDLDNEFAFLAHSDAFFSFTYGIKDRLGHPSISHHVEDLKNICNDDGRDLNLTVEILLGTYPDRESINTIKNNLSKLASSSINKFRIVSINEVDSFCGSILFDSRTGKKYAYDRSLNPFFIPNDTMEKNLYMIVDALTTNKKHTR